MKARKKKLPDLLADLEEEATLAAVEQRLSKGQDPLDILKECREGIVEVGRRYERGEYFISGLIMSGEIMRQVSDLILPVLKDRLTGDASGRILLGTVQGDIHSIGKNIFKTFLQCFGFTVCDVGEDAAPAEFLKQAAEDPPQIIALSCLLTATYDSMAETIRVLKKAGADLNPVPRIIIGGMVDEKVCRHVGADAWSNDAMNGVRLCQRFTRPPDNG
jgi:methanogenic corrinoid protein MtbC1